jgi:hypothetical protein
MRCEKFGINGQLQNKLFLLSSSVFHLQKPLPMLRTFVKKTVDIILFKHWILNFLNPGSLLSFFVQMGGAAFQGVNGALATRYTEACCTFCS